MTRADRLAAAIAIALADVEIPKDAAIVIVVSVPKSNGTGAYDLRTLTPQQLNPHLCHAAMREVIRQYDAKGGQLTGQWLPFPRGQA